jgi:hypothetical protein
VGPRVREEIQVLARGVHMAANGIVSARGLVEVGRSEGNWAEKFSYGPGTNLWLFLISVLHFLFYFLFQIPF